MGYAKYIDFDTSHDIKTVPRSGFETRKQTGIQRVYLEILDDVQGTFIDTYIHLR